MKILYSLVIGATSVALLSSQQVRCEDRGTTPPGMGGFDRAVQELMTRWDIPGASLAVAKDGKIVLAKGYGYADREEKAPVTPETMFRMGSINKTVTAVAALKLVEAGKLSLDQSVLPILAKASLVPEKLGDARMSDIKVRHLLNHSAGLDRNASGDPFFGQRLKDVARRQGTAPVTCEAIIRDSLEQRLDFAPGERFAYSNVGYCILGKVVEIQSGESFRSHIGREVLLPSTGKDFRTGRSTESMTGEAKYYDYSGARNEMSAPGISSLLGVPAPYGSYSIESMEALGAWVATPSQVLKFFLAIDGTRGARLLSEQSVRLVREAPSLSSGNTEPNRFYGLGVNVVKTRNGDTWWHDGGQPGLATMAVRAAEGYAWVIAVNTRPKQQDRAAFNKDLDSAMWSGARSVSTWPSTDIDGGR